MTEAEKVRKGAMSKTTPKAAHDYNCDWCHEIIRRGNMYVRYVYGDHKQRYSKHYHIKCWEEM